MHEDESDFGVWHCEETEWECETWAAPLSDPPRVCPSCTGPEGEHIGMRPGAPIRYIARLDHVRLGEEELGIEPCDSPVRIPRPPPFELVRLTTLPQEMWLGLPVFYPMAQLGGDREPPVCNWYHYDVGVVAEILPGPPLEVRFIVDDTGHGLHYAPHWLWVPKALAERLLGRAL